MVINVQLNKATTMRKEYRKPELMTITLKPMQFIANSERKEYGQETPTVEGMDAKSGFGGWDDDVEPGEDY